MEKIIGYTDQINECECCGKSKLKGTFCLEIDGVERYYGSTCAFKKHITTKEIKTKFQSLVKWAEKQAVINCRRKNDIQLVNYTSEFKKLINAAA